MSISLAIAWKVVTDLAKGFFKMFGIPGLIVAGVIAFYEGIFFLNFWPINNIPYIGKVIEGEISRRIEADRAKQLLIFERNNAEAERALAEMERVFRAREVKIKASNIEAIDDLQKSIVKREADFAGLTSEVLEARLQAARSKNEAERTAAEMQLMRDNPVTVTETITKTVNGQCKPKIVYRKYRNDNIPDDVIESLRRMK